MIRAFAYYLLCTGRNMALTRVRRLRQPKYLISALAGLAYFYYFFLAQFFRPGRSHARLPQAINPELFPVAEIGFSLLLLVAVLLPWLWPGGGKGVLFTEAEIQFLFPAPVSRRSLLRFRLAKNQIGILFGVLVSVFFLRRGDLFPHAAFLLSTLWLVYSFLSCYYMAASLAKASLLEHGISGLRREAWVLGLVALTLASIGVWIKWFIPQPPSIEKLTLAETLGWITAVSSSGPAFYFLLPFKTLLHPAFSPDTGTFLVRFVPGLAVLAAVYLWVMSGDASFAEAAIERAGKVARRLEAARNGRSPIEASSTGKVRRPPFRLAGEGPPAVAILWKNLTSAGRFQLRFLVLIVLGLLFVIGMLRHGRGGASQVVPAVIGTTTAIMACFLAILGPLMMRDDLRSDLLHVDLIKTFPISGRGIVAGEILAPAAVLALAEWALILIAAAILPNLDKTRMLPLHRITFGLTAAILFPCISLIGLLIQNLAALLFPAWMQLGMAQQRGIEATGQRLITMALSSVSVAVAAIPAGLAFAVIFFSGYWIIGLTVMPLAALAAASIMLAEAWIGVIWTGRLFERFDPSLELDGIGERT